MYANRNSNNILFKDKLEKWKNEFPNQLEIKHFLSEEENPQHAIKGYVTRISLEEILNQNDKNKIDFYLCGPEIMTTKVIEDLIYLGITSSKIHRELFLIKTQNNKQSLSLNAKITARINGKNYQFETPNGKTILESGLDQSIPLPYSCQSGLCGMCKMKCS
jgi:ring-1,2-phenylacetyl-CoA epoxidase subunit PaaE